MGITGQCWDNGPGGQFECPTMPAGTNWAVLPQPGNGGLGCQDPEPNVCFQPTGTALGFSSGNPGMALISALQLDPTQLISIEEVVTLNLDCTQPVSYHGPVIYWGEGPPSDPLGNYDALYLSCGTVGAGPQIQAYAYYGAMDTAVLIGPATYAQGSTHALRIDYVPGVSITWLIDDLAVKVDTIATVTAAQLSFGGSPQPALWFGGATGSVSRFDVYTGS